MKKTSLNFLVDALAFAAFALLATTGVLLRYVLPPGSGHFSQLWGMTRHEWGQVHFWISLIFMVFLGLHLFLHWRWIAVVIKGRARDGVAPGMRVALGLVGLAGLLGLAAAPFFQKVETSGQPPHRGRITELKEGPDFGVVGSMTLADIGELTGVPVDVFTRELGLPSDLPTHVRLGRLRKKYPFEMHQVREILRTHLRQP